MYDLEHKLSVEQSVRERQHKKLVLEVRMAWVGGFTVACVLCKFVPFVWSLVGHILAVSAIGGMAVLCAIYSTVRLFKREEYEPDATKQAIIWAKEERSAQSGPNL